MAYPVLVDVKAYLKVAGAGEDGLLQQLLDAAISFVEGWCGRKFTRALGQTKVVPEYPHRVGSRKLLVKADVYSVTSIQNGDGSLIGANEYLLLPFSGPPYWCIELKPWAAWSRGADGSGVVTISGDIGLDCPADVSSAVLELVAYLYRSRTTGAGGAVTTATRQGLIIPASSVPGHVLEVLNLHRRSAG